MFKFYILLPLILLSACAALQPAPPAPPPKLVPQYIVPEGTEFVSTLFGYSQAVRVGPWVSISAVPGFDLEKRGFPKEFEDQVAAAFALLKLVVEAAGAQLTDVTEITSYQLDMDKFFVTVDARNEAFGLHRPAWTAVGVKSLPLPQMQFQISARVYAPLGAPGANAKSGASVQSSDNDVPAQPEKAPPSKSPKPFLNRPGY